MDQLTLHNALVHLPLGLSIGTAFLAVLLAVAVWRNWLPVRSLALLVALEAVVLLGGAAAFRAGERAEESGSARVGEAAVKMHEERAETFLWLTGGALLVSAVALAARRPPWSRWGVAAASAGALAAAAAGIWTGKAGGAIAHPAATAAAGGPAAGGPATGEDHDDD